MALLGVAFLAALMLAIVLHLDLDVTKRVVVSIVNDQLASTFRGSVRLEHIAELHAQRLAGAQVRIADPAGNPRLRADGVSVRWSLARLLSGLLWDADEQSLTLESITIAYVDVDLSAGDDGTLELVRAFESSEPTAQPAPEGSQLVLTLPRIELGHVWVHGEPIRELLVDADVDHVRGSLEVAPRGVDIRVVRTLIATRSMPREANVDGVLSGSLWIPVPSDVAATPPRPPAAAAPSRLTAKLQLEGHVAEVPTSLRGSLEGDDLVARLRVGPTRGALLRGMVGSWAADSRVSLRARVTGRLPDLALRAVVRANDSVALVDGTLQAKPPFEGVLRLRARNIDTSAIALEAPESSLGLDAHATFTLGGADPPRIQVRAEVLPGTLAGQAVPPARLQARFADPLLTVSGRIREPGAAADFEVELNTERKRAVVDLTAHSEQLERSRRLPFPIRGKASLRAQGTAWLDDQPRIDASVRGSFRELHLPQVRLQSGSVALRARGTVTNPELDGVLRVVGLTVADRTISRGKLTVRGPLRTAKLQIDTEVADLGRVDATGQLSLGATTRVVVPTVTLQQTGGLRVQASARSIAFGDGVFELVDGTVAGLGGKARLSLTRRQSALHARIEARNLDAQRIAMLLPNALPISGRVSMVGDVTVSPHRADGQVQVELSGLAWAGEGRASGTADVRFAGRRIEAHMRLHDPELGVLELNRGAIELGGGSLFRPSWPGVTGDVACRGRVKLEPLLGLLAKAGVDLSKLPWRPADGSLIFDAAAYRTSRDELPNVVVTARTQGLALAPTGGEASADRAPALLEAVDGSVAVSFDGSSRRAAGYAAITRQGRPLSRMSAQLDVTPRLLAALRDGSTVHAVDALRRAPARATLWLPRQPIAALPFAPKDVAGDLELLATLSGTATTPDLRVSSRVTGLAMPAPFPIASSADGEIQATYDGRQGSSTVVLQSGGQPVLVAQARFDLPLSVALAREGASPWHAALHAAFRDLPLDVRATGELPALHTKLTGQVSLSDWHRDARLRVAVHTSPISVGTIQTGRLKLTAQAGGGRLRATARADQPAGYAVLTAKHAIQWGAELVPSLKPDARPELRLQARGFQLRPVARLAGDVVRDLDGVVDANLRVRVRDKPSLEGALSLRDGRVQLAGFGERFDDVQVKLRFEPGGAVHLQRLSARSMGGQVRATGQVKLDGTRLTSAQAMVRIPEEKPLPIVVGGEPVGTVFGRIELTARPASNRQELLIGVKVPTLRATLPDAPPKSLQSLAPAPHVRVGVRQPSGRITSVSPDPTQRPSPGRAGRASPPEPAKAAQGAVRISIELGREVEIRRGQGARVRLTGSPVVRLGDRVVVQGEIRLLSGRVDLHGRRFTIEEGTVTFVDDDPANPTIVATASWTAPDGTVVYADYVGPLRTGKVTLRSDPARSRNEILALLLFGTADRNLGESGSAAGAIGLASGQATEGLNRGLQDLSGLDVATRVDTSRSNNPSPEIEVQLARDLTLQFAHVLGLPPPGDRPDKNLSTLSWRFYRNWAVETTVGDKGSTMLDLLWQYSY